MNIGISPKATRRCLLRSGMLNAAYNTRGLQSMGFLYAVMPALREIYPDDEAFAESCSRYSGYFNCNVVWAPFLCGAFIHTERQIAAGSAAAGMVEILKETTLNSLSAVGDSFFSGSLMVSLMLILSCLVLLGSPHAAGVLLPLWLLAVIFLKVVTFYFGLARGFTLLRVIRRLNLINKGDYLKLFNSILLTALLALVLGFPSSPPGAELGLPAVVQSWFLPIGVMILLSYAVARIHLSRSLALAAMLIGTGFFI